jgi:two-component sensor histidine kinase/CHASE2 domain-containing sensor protein
MLHRRAISILLIAALTTFLGVSLSRSPEAPVARAELAARDSFTVHARRTPANPKLIFLAIDSESIGLDVAADLHGLFGIEDETTPEARALTLMSEHWPWPRSVYPLVLDRLMQAGARVVVLDLLFPTASASDAPFKAALDRYRDRVVIGSNFISSNREERNAFDATLTLPDPAIIPQTGAPDDRIGYVNFWPDTDGVIRSAHFQTNFALFLGSSADLGETDYPSLAAQAVRKVGRPELVPPDTGGHTFRYTAGPGDGFPPRSIFEIFVPEYWERNYQSGAVFKDAIVVIGSAGNWQHDEHQTPFGLMSGPEIQLNVVNALLHGELLKPVSRHAHVAICVLAGALAACVALFCTTPLLRIGLLLTLGAAWAGAQFPLMDRLNLLAPIIAPLAIGAGIGLFSVVYDLVRAGAEQLRLRLRLQERKRAQEILEGANEELERRVAERTVELTKANTLLTGSLAEKDVLLKEIHHRVKNNLQVISSLLNLQSGYIKDPEALQVFTESRNRVRSMALIHEKLYQTSDLARIDFEDYIKALTSGLMAGFAGKSSSVRIAVEVEKIMLAVDSAVPCGLIVNELVTNCFKYAFAPATPGEIRISMRRNEDSRLQLTVSDNGVGFPKDVDFRNTESLGLQLVNTLTEQLDGTVALHNGTGTTFEITFPESKKSKA